MRISMRKYALLSILLLGIVFLSGCINQPPATKGGKGLAISSFAPDFAEIRSGEPVTLSALITNAGEGDATGVKAQLFGLNMGAAGEGKEWTLKTGSSTLTTQLLRKADPSLNLQGENYEFSWTVVSPGTLRVDNTYTANLRVYYKYKTYSTSILHFVSYDYIKSLPTDQFNAEKAKAGVAQSTSSTAPVSVKISGGNRPFIAYSDDASAPDTFSVQIDITNVDSGNAFIASAYPTGFSSDNLHKVNVNIDTNLDLNCANTLSSAKSGQITMTKGQSKTIFCTATVQKNALDNARDYTVNVELDYGYYLDASTKVTVLKKEGPITGGTGGTGGQTGTNTPSLTLSSNLLTPKIRESITLSGDLTYGNVPLASKNVKLTIGTTTQTVATNQNGHYEAYYTVASVAEFNVKAEFAGDSNYAKATSSEITIKPLAVTAYYPYCKITESGTDTYVLPSTKMTIFYKSGVISSFKVSAVPDSSSNVISKLSKVSFPATTSDGKDVTSSQDGTSFSHTYAIRPESTYSNYGTATFSYVGGESGTCTFGVLMDKDKPATTFTEQQLSETKYRIALDCNDGSGSGCTKIYYCAAATGASCTPAAAAAGSTVTFDYTCTGKCDVKFYSIDNVNNREDTKTETFGV